jgi:hypothetical protein
MLALEQPLPRVRPGLFHRTPVAALALLAGVWALAAATLPDTAARAAGLAAAQGGLLGTALTWTSPWSARDRWAPLEAALVVGAAATCALVLPWGALAYTLVLAWIGWRRPAWLTRFTCHPAPALAAGTCLGLLLGAHLLVNASLTFGYRLRAGSWAELIGWWAYDAGANVLAAEAFFRAGLFERARRQWSLVAAAALSTAAFVIRYLIDPLLPRALPIAAGAAFYLALLGAGNCWLLARTGSLAPGLAASAVFFGAYRLLAR